MEAAAKKVQLLAQRILPDRPHHLSVSPDQRFRVPPDHIKSFEEFKHPRLQYMTLLSDADRGMLLTRPYYDMREEPPNPTAHKESNTKMEKKAVTKLSLSDYKNKQKKAADSPPESRTTPKPDTSRKEKEATDGRIEREPKKMDAYRSRDSEASKDLKAHRPREHTHDERTGRPETKARTAQESNDTPEKRKRNADADNELRPQKRARPEASTPLDERLRTPRDDTPRRKDVHSSHDRTPQKDGKLSTSFSSLPNGRSGLKSALGSGSSANKSPVSRARGDSINGSRPTPSGSRARAEPASSRSAVPPLLSPLHLPNESDSRPKEKRRDDVGEHNRPLKSLKSEPPPPIKRPKSPIDLPELLSPTLPPIVEEELARMKKTPTKSSASGQRIYPPDSPTTSKRSHIVVKEEDEDRKEPKEKVKDRPRRFMVTLKYSKKYNKSVQRLLALPPRKDVKKERSVSIEPPAPPQARKRPISSAEHIGDSIAVKRPRTSDITSSSKLVTPSTPSKAATTMSRVASSNSVNTPGDGSGLTPAAPPSSDRDRPQTRDDSREAANPSKVQSLRDRWGRYIKLGTKLKHERDMLLERKNSDRGAPISDSDSKLSMILGLETALAFMVGFRALVESRRMENKAQDPKQWGSILPLLNVMRHDVRKSKPLEALFWQLQGVIHEELIKCYWSLDPASHAVHIIGAERARSTVWKSAFDAVERVEASAMRTNMGPWTSVEDAVASALRIMRRWTQEENVSWRAEVTASAANGTSS
ncbi:hypothetical protein CGRA01v4_01073 [Colletotrichum graminicola]|uniref:Uncharacterized protein n=1 Tax=Colletotrichum graminicola (strain M1.001 / M2 / FGSC 10212) TaxID=645133 RepID=E3QGQ3_COLGM|nr:uncharacterized protein GLRG_05185 [Colletotrichum graminicola M1.001]EFQ30041.1 hypothetical protein GLRG_05185 [Colletotrichum graminicola M1.001]WDK09795.1 hypothetical protein CGRA01v4_01073 [Colletotrichum graminicola]